MNSETMQRGIDAVESWLSWLPDWTVALIVLAVAMLLALAAHAVFMWLSLRVTGRWNTYLHTLILRTRGITKMAFVILAVSVAVRSPVFTVAWTAALSQILLVAFIVLVGWAAATAVSLATELYVARFQIDVADNLLARKHVTQMRLLRRAVLTLVFVVTVSAALMTFESVREYGVSLFASAGVAGLVVGFAARPLLSNLIAGVQIAMTQPIRLEDVVIVEGEFGWVEEITSTYVVVRVWDWRRVILPLTYFIERPFQNWTREKASLIGAVLLYVDYAAPVDRLRAKVEEIAKSSPLWDGQVVNLQVTDCRERTMELRALVSAANAGDAWNLRCLVREKLLDFLRAEHPDALPRVRAEIDGPVPVDADSRIGGERALHATAR
ncbi:MAG: mechanosensitive ion channel family protein [Rhodospirillales bacterium]